MRGESEREGKELTEGQVENENEEAHVPLERLDEMRTRRQAAMALGLQRQYQSERSLKHGKRRRRNRSDGTGAGAGAGAGAGMGSSTTQHHKDERAALNGLAEVQAAQAAQAVQAEVEVIRRPFTIVIPTPEITSSPRHSSPCPQADSSNVERDLATCTDDGRSSSSPDLLDLEPTTLEEFPCQNGNEDGNNSTAQSAASSTRYMASPDSKFECYAVRVDTRQDDKAAEIALYSFQRPHMRAFHFAWMSFFVAFFTWFALSPLLSEVQLSLHLTKEEIWTSSICGVAGTILMRIFSGPACDKFGARPVMALILATSAIPTISVGVVNSIQGLCTMRLFIGIAGGSFVACQYWTSTMFIKEVAGTANALVSGWGNLGGGVTQIVMGSVLFPLFKFIYCGTLSSQVEENKSCVELAWRTVCVVPGILSLAMSFLIWKWSDDSPKGNYSKRMKYHLMQPVSAKKSMGSAIRDWNTWLLFIQYGCCFGVEITMNNAAALYFKEEFQQTTEAAAAIASVFGWMNLFARGLGGFASDMLNAKYGMKGRLFWQFVTLLLEGITIVIFGFANTLGGAIFAMVVFSIWVQSAEGSTFGLVPYVNSRFTGAIVGLVGAGGNVGGVIFSSFFRNFDYQKSFLVMGLSVMASSFLSFLIHIKGYKLTRCWFCTVTPRQRLETSLSCQVDHPEIDGHEDGRCVDDFTVEERVDKSFALPNTDGAVQGC